MMQTSPPAAAPAKAANAAAAAAARAAPSPLRAGGERLPLARGGVHALAGCAVVLALAPWALSEYQVYALAVSFGYAVAALGIGMAFSSLGILALGQSAFMAIGAFASILLLEAQVPFAAVLALCLLLGLACGALYGLLAGRLALFPLAVVGFAFAFLVMDLGNGNLLKRITGGETGRPVPAGTLFGADVSQGMPMYWLSLALLLACMGVALLAMRSSFGRALLAIRRDEMLAASCGVNVPGAKVVLLSLATGLGTLGGAMVAQFTNFASPLQFSPALTVSLLAMALVGGARYLAGPLVGTLILDTLPHLVKMRADDRQVLVGVLLLAVLVLARHGLLSWFEPLYRALRGRAAEKGERT
jgi:branched-chain amino acid transport system permease protein